MSMKLFGFALLTGLIIGCAQAPTTPVIPGAPASTPVATAIGPAGWSVISGNVTKVDKEGGLLELQTPSGWTQFLLSEPEKRKALGCIVVGERVDVNVELRDGERKVVSVAAPNCPPAERAEAK